MLVIGVEGIKRALENWPINILQVVGSPLEFLLKVAVICWCRKCLPKSREKVTTDELALDSDVRSRFCDIRVAVGSTGMLCSENKSFCSSIAIDIELFHNCKGMISFGILVALDVEEVESGRGTSSDSADQDGVYVVVICHSIIWV